MFSEISGLPLHPLVVHAVVVLVPLSTLGAVVVAAYRPWARPYAPLVALGAAGAAVAAWVARAAGDELAEALGAAGETAALIADHGRWGLYTAVTATGFAVLAVAAAAPALRPRLTSQPVARTMAVLAALAGVLATVFTVLAGDSGSRAVWSGVLGG